MAKFAPIAAALLAITTSAAHAQAGGRFDLTGPPIDVHVQRGDRSLPVAEVPNLLPGDHLSIHADLPITQSVKLIMVVAFLRGSTNPPPENWFTRVNTWDKKVRAEGVNITVPAEAQQALIFIAPETGGDFSTLKSAVTGRPGIFVRAAQDLNEASFEQARIERYLQAIKRVPATAPPAELLDHSHKLAATLNLKPNDDCFKKPADQQLACLRQTGSQLLLDDGHGQTMAAMLTNGDSANLIGAVAGTPMANTGGAAAYSAYVGTVIDVVRLMSGLHTAHFQYIPAIAFPDEDTLNLRLNTPPSFHDPKSVIVVALPAIQKSTPPPLHLQDANHVSCLLQPAMVLPLEGAPLVFATGFAHDMVLHLNDGATLNGKTDLPLSADAFEGGLVLSTEKSTRKPLPVAAPEARDSADNPVGVPAAVANKSSEESTSKDLPAAANPAAAEDTGATGPVQVTGTLRGQWGFDSFEGVTVPLQRRVGGDWTAARTDLFAGRSNDLILHADGTACTSAVELDGPGDHDIALRWKQTAANDKDPAPLDVKLPLEKTPPGNLHLLVHQYGTAKVENVAVVAYSDATRLSALHLHAGDTAATLTGSGLADVRSLKLSGTEYKPVPDTPEGKEVRLVATPGTPQKPHTAGETGSAEATLADGRTIPVTYTVDAARPSLTLLSKTAKPDQQTGLPLALGSSDDLPLNARITIALRSTFPARFPRTEKVEIALADGSLHTILSVADGSVVLQDQHTALAFLSPAKAFGTSAFGPLQLRPVAEDGTAGDWIPLGTLVRTPVITGFSCSRTAPRQAADDPAAAGCQVSGANLFLVDAFAADSTFAAPVSVPLGFAGESLPVPRPADNHTLFLKLRDDPGSVTTIAASLSNASRKAPAAPAGTSPSASPQTPAPDVQQASPTAENAPSAPKADSPAADPSSRPSTGTDTK